MLRRLALCLVIFAIAWAEDWHGRVVGIHDGDTLELLRGAKSVKVRLYGIDCPELGQPYGRAAKQRAAELVFGKTVAVQGTRQDRYGRSVAWITMADGRALNAELVRSGLAWWYRKYAPKQRALALLEEAARDAHRGLWADEDPVPPWLWRKVPHDMR